MGQLKPTKRFMIEPLLNCNADCVMCYHKHKKSEWNKYTKTLDVVKKEIDAGIARGNNYMDITGGEPTMYEHICDVVLYAKTQGVRTCIITNGMVSDKKADELLDAGIHGFLVSRHGLYDVHNSITGVLTSYDRQIEFLDRINDKVQLRFNCVITKYNQSQLMDIAFELAKYNPAIVNFINFNPHHEWVNNKYQAKEFICDMTTIYDDITVAIDILKGNCIGVNVRYFPMCRISEKHYECICNDNIVTLDPYEWDYCIQPKTFENHAGWNKNCSNSNEMKKEPCASCGLFAQCGGINERFYSIAGSNCISPISINHGTDIYKYRATAGIQIVEPV